MDFLQLEDAYLGVDRGGVEVLVAEQLLDVADVGPAFEHVGGAGVAQQMATALARAHLLQPGPHHARDHVRVERPAVPG